MIEKVTAAPGHYEWPQGDAELLPENTALLLIDFQVLVRQILVGLHARLIVFQGARYILHI